MMLLQGDVLAHVTTIINTDAYKLYSIYYILYVLCLYIIDLTVQFHCYTVIEMLLQFTVIIAKVAPSIATKTGLRESLLTYGFLDYVHGYMFFLTMGLIKHFFFFFFFFLVAVSLALAGHFIIMFLYCQFGQIKLISIYLSKKSRNIQK